MLFHNHGRENVKLIYILDLEFILLRISISKTKKTRPEQLNERRLTQNKVYRQWLLSNVISCLFISVKVECLMVLLVNTR